MSEMIDAVERLTSPVLADEGFELVDVTYQREPGGWTLAFYLDKPGGISIDDCARWSDRLGTLLDESGVVSHAYNLEVSSPGVYRALKKTADFLRFVGERVRVKLFAPHNGQKNFLGKLEGADDEALRLRLEDGPSVTLPRAMVAKAHLDPVIEI